MGLLGRHNYDSILADIKTALLKVNGIDVADMEEMYQRYLATITNWATGKTVAESDSQLANRIESIIVPEQCQRGGARLQILTAIAGYPETQSWSKGYPDIKNAIIAVLISDLGTSAIWSKITFSAMVISEEPSDRGAIEAYLSELCKIGYTQDDAETVTELVLQGFFPKLF